MNDAKEIMALRSNEQVNEFLERPKSIDLNGAKKFIEKIVTLIDDNESVYWVIALKENDVLIGTICCWNISVENDTAEIGYELHPTYQGKGFMQEATSKVLDYCFNKMQLKTIIAFTHPANDKSRRLLEKNNFLMDATNKYSGAGEAGEQVVYFLSR